MPAKRVTRSAGSELGPGSAARRNISRRACGRCSIRSRTRPPTVSSRATLPRASTTRADGSGTADERRIADRAPRVPDIGRDAAHRSRARAMACDAADPGRRLTQAGSRLIDTACLPRQGGEAMARAAATTRGGERGEVAAAHCASSAPPVRPGARREPAEALDPTRLPRSYAIFTVATHVRSRHPATIASHPASRRSQAMQPLSEPSPRETASRVRRLEDAINRIARQRPSR